MTQFYKPNLYGTSDGKKFDLIAVYCPNEENDPWVQYVNVETKQEYTCRKEAFEARFVKLP
jgi:hypothetical protein